MTTEHAAAVSISSADGITLQRLARAGGYAGPNDGVPGPNTWKGLQQTVTGYGYAGTSMAFRARSHRALQRLAAKGGYTGPQ